jgi:hypothetical protein
VHDPLVTSAEHRAIRYLLFGSGCMISVTLYTCFCMLEWIGMMFFDAVYMDMWCDILHYCCNPLQWAQLQMKTIFDGLLRFVVLLFNALTGALAPVKRVVISTNGSDSDFFHGHVSRLLNLGCEHSDMSFVRQNSKKKRKVRTVRSYWCIVRIIRYKDRKAVQALLRYRVIRKSAVVSEIPTSGTEKA